MTYPYYAMLFALGCLLLAASLMVFFMIGTRRQNWTLCKERCWLSLIVLLCLAPFLVTMWVY